MGCFTGSYPGWSSASIRPPKIGEKRWGPAVWLIGWNEKYIIGQNSWGENWGDKGLFYFDQNYLPLEAWVILVDLPNDFEFVKKPQHEFLKDLEYGMRNNEVVWLQDCLKYEACFPIEVQSTGYFGTITLRSAQKFQAKYGISQTGYVGPITRKKLNEIFS